MIEVVWSETAIQTYLRIVDYLFIEWTQKEINEFEKDVESLLAKISENHLLCKSSKIPPYRKCVVNKQISLVYAVFENVIYLNTFLHNRSNHSF